MKINPINGNIVVEVDNEAEKTQSGLLVPQVKGERMEAYAIRGVVREIATDIEELQEDPLNPGKWVSTKKKVKAGDKVLVAKWEGQKTVLDGRDIIIVKQKDILGVLS